jgi:hypothetical protein
MSKSLEQSEHERAILVGSRTAELLNNEYSPLVRENFEEFLRELVEDEECVTLLFESANQRKRCGEFTSSFEMGLVLDTYLHKYWGKRAVLHAEADIPSALDTMGDERGSGRCNGR